MHRWPSSAHTHERTTSTRVVHIATTRHLLQHLVRLEASISRPKGVLVHLTEVARSIVLLLGARTIIKV